MIAAIIDERVTANQAVRDAHERGEACQTPMPPDAVAFVETAAQAQATIEFVPQNSTGSHAFSDLKDRWE